MCKINNTQAKKNIFVEFVSVEQGINKRNEAEYFARGVWSGAVPNICKAFEA